MTIASRIAAAALAMLLAACMGGYGYAPDGRRLSLREQSLQTLDQASQQGNRAN